MGYCGLFFNYVLTVLLSYTVFYYRLMSFSNSRQLYFLCRGVFNCRLLATSDSFLTYLHLRLFCLQIVCIFACSCRCFCLRLRVFFPAFGGYFYLRLKCFCLSIACIFSGKTRQFCMLVAGNFAWVAHVKLPLIHPLYSSKCTRGCRQFACILREVLAA